jgi:hypothetical protein
MTATTKAATERIRSDLNRSVSGYRLRLAGQWLLLSAAKRCSRPVAVIGSVKYLA